MFQVLIVCTGNTCRSPMGEAILRSILTDDLSGQVSVSSAGSVAGEGSPAAAFAVQTAAARGLDLSKHRSRPLTAELVREADLVLGMEPAHVSAAKSLAPDSADRVRLVTEYGAEGGAADGIRDPIYGGPDDYVDTFNRIRSHMLRWLPFIREAVERREGVR
jgi:protein arginine phosphatase